MKPRIPPPSRISTIVHLMRQELVELSGERGRLEETSRQIQERITAIETEPKRLEEAYKEEV